MTDAPLHLPLTRGEASALLSLADLGRVYLDVDPRALAAPGQRDSARRAMRRLRDLTKQPASGREVRAAADDRGPHQRT